MPIIKVEDKNIEIEDGANLRTSLISNGYQITSTCGGCASCGLCVVAIKSGDENLSEFTFEEKQILGNVFHITKERLSCQTFVNGNIEVDVSMHQQKSNTNSKNKTIRRKSGEIPEKVAVERPPKEGGFRRPRAFKPEKENK